MQDGYAEAVMKALKTLADTFDQRHDNAWRQNLMWAANQALCGIIGVGVPHDWATHRIAVQLTALYGIDHGRTLSILQPWLLRESIGGKRAKLEQMIDILAAQIPEVPPKAARKQAMAAVATMMGTLALARIAGTGKFSDDILGAGREAVIGRTMAAPALDAPAAATGRFRALDTEVVAAPDSTQAARAMGYTGDSCVTCGSVRMVMDGRCAKCLECGSTAGGCS